MESLDERYTTVHSEMAIHLKLHSMRTLLGQIDSILIAGKIVHAWKGAPLAVYLRDGAPWDWSSAKNLGAFVATSQIEETFNDGATITPPWRIVYGITVITVYI